MARKQRPRRDKRNSSARPNGSAQQRVTAGRPSRSWRIFVAIVILVVVGAFFVSRVSLRHRLPERARPLNLLLVTLDTTRADHLGIYGYTRARTSHIDRLAREGTRFEWAFSPAPLTLPAHASILTGLYPFVHGVRNNGNFYLDARFPTLATVLKKQGYRTAAFVSAFILDRRYGLARGFDTYDDTMQADTAQIVSLEAERRGDRTALALGAWLDAYAATRGAAPFFAWLHLYDPHEPYHAPPPFGPAFSDSPYDGEISFDDAIVASVMDRLQRLGLEDDTLVAIIGDHGESLGEHGEETHSMFVYDATIRVPFILRAPGVVPANRVVQQIVRATDLAPTVLDLLGAPRLETHGGRSLVALMRGEHDDTPPPAYAESLFPQLYMNWAPIRALREERWKFIDAPQAELYDTRSDGGEVRNLRDERPDTARALERQLQRLTGGETGQMSVGRMDRETLEKLASLGYVGAGAEPAREASPSRVDPKEMIGVFNRLRDANRAVRERRFDDALPILREVLERDPRNAFAQLVMGSARMGMGDYTAAIAQYRRYLDLVPSSSYAHQWMAICYLRLEDKDGALREADAALAIDPHFSDARILKAGVLAGRGNHAAAVSELRAAVASDPSKAVIRLDLAKVLAEAGREDEAQAEYRAALDLRPEYTPALVGLGALYAQQSNYDKATDCLRRALTLEPGNAEARFDLAKVLQQQGRIAEARQEYQRIIDAPDASPAVRSAALDQIRALVAK